MIGYLISYNIIAVSIIFLISGLILAFRGSRFVPFALIIAGLTAGLLYSGGLLVKITANPDIIKFGPMVIAVLLAVLVSFLYRLAFFVAGFIIGFFITTALFPDLSIIYISGVAIFAGVLVYISRNFVFSVLTSIMGGSLVATAVISLLAWIRISAGIPMYWGIYVIITISGLLYQIKSNKGRK